MKIFIYKIPDNLLYLTYKDKLEHEDKGFINSYKLEFYMNRIFANSSADYITEDIDSADFYYIPQYYSVIWQALRAKSVPVAYLDDIIEFIQREYGTYSGQEHRHIIACSADHGLFALPGFEKTRSSLRKCIHLQHKEETNLSLSTIQTPFAPYYHESTHPKGRCETLDSDGTGKEILCYFSGTIHMPSAHPYADQYSKGVRQYLFKIRSKFKNIIINEGIDPNYRANVRKSRYFLCPEGWAPSSHRFREAQAALCIPVLISDAKKPFWKYIDYESNIIRISTDDTESLDRLEEILENDLATDYDRKVDFWRKHRKFLLMDPTKGLEQPCGTLILKELEDYLN